jgi:hypothetical protein
LELAIQDVDGLRRAQKDGSGVGMAVGPFVGKQPSPARLEVVVTVASIGWSPSLEKVLEIGQEQRFVLVYRDRGGRMLRVYVDEAVGDPRAANALPDELRQVDELLSLLGSQMDEITRHSERCCFLLAHEETDSHGKSSFPLGRALLLVKIGFSGRSVMSGK